MMIHKDNGGMRGSSSDDSEPREAEWRVVDKPIQGEEGTHELIDRICEEVPIREHARQAEWDAERMELRKERDELLRCFRADVDARAA